MKRIGGGGGEVLKYYTMIIRLKTSIIKEYINSAIVR